MIVRIRFDIDHAAYYVERKHKAWLFSRWVPAKIITGYEYTYSKKNPYWKTRYFSNFSDARSFAVKAATDITIENKVSK